MRDIHGANLNLLPALHSLLTHRSVSLAARAAGLTQPAMSHSLKKLRALFGDPLLVPGQGGLMLTPRAEELRDRVGRTLAEIESLVREPEAFVPGTTETRFVVGAPDYFDVVVLPRLHGTLSREAPGASIRMRRASPLGVAKGLDTGDFDVALGVALPSSQGLMECKLLDETFACAVAASHPLAGAPVDLDAFVSFPHALVTLETADAGAVDQALAARGRKATTRVAVPSFLSAPYLVGQSELVLTAPRRVLEALAAPFGLRLFEPPVPLPGFTLKMYWHERSAKDPANTWLRKRILEAARAHGGTP